MEGAALRIPPEKLDSLVRLLIPPAVREEVTGDLWETYQNPEQYAREALRTVPLVVFSQVRRHFNLPALLLQGVLLYACLGPVAAALILPLLMVAAAYQPATRPTPRRAMREAIMVAFAVLALLQAAWGTSGDWKFSTDGIRLGLQLFFVGPCLSPLLCLLRTGLIVDGDRRPSLGSREWTTDELAGNRDRLIVRLRRARVMEAAALAAAAIVSWRFLDQGVPGLVLALLFTVTALLLVLDMPAAADAGDFLSVRAGYQRLLTRQQQLRSFLWWLWCTPAVLVLHSNAVALASDGNLIKGLLRAVAAIMLCFFVNALNREGAGWAQEQISLLGRMREKLA